MSREINPPEANDTLARYVNAVERVRQQRSTAPDADERRAIARELGLSDEDLEAARSRGETQLITGEGFLRHELWDDAVSALSEADALLPEQVRVLFALARAHAGRWKETGHDDDRIRADAFARRCLELQPRHKPSFELLRTLSAPRPSTRGSSRAVPGIGATIILVIVALAGATGVWAIRRASNRAAGRGDKATPRPAAATVAEVCPAGSSGYCTLPLNVTLGATLDGPELQVRLQPPGVGVARATYRVELGGTAKHLGATELEVLRLALRLLDRTGTEVARVPVDVHGSFRPPMRSGDSEPFYITAPVQGIPTRGELAVLERRTVPAPASYGALPKLVIERSQSQPAHFVIDAFVRAREARDYYKVNGKSAADLVAAVVNSGEGVIRKLELKLVPFDASGRELGPTYGETIAYEHMPPMMPGETRVAKLHYYVAGQVAAERLVVAAVR